MALIGYFQSILGAYYHIVWSMPVKVGDQVQFQVSNQDIKLGL